MENFNSEAELNSAEEAKKHYGKIVGWLLIGALSLILILLVVNQILVHQADELWKTIEACQTVSSAEIDDCIENHDG